MNQYLTEFKAIRQRDGELITYCGPNIPGICLSDAKAYCERNGLGHLKILGVLIAEIPCKEGTHEPDFSKMVDYEKISLN